MLNKTGTLSQRQLSLDNLTQRLAKEGGMPIYQDTGGTIILDNYFLPDNTNGQVRYDTLIKGSSVGKGDEVLWGDLEYHSEYSIQNFEVEIKIDMSEMIDVELADMGFFIINGDRWNAFGFALSSGGWTQEHNLVLHHAVGGSSSAYTTSSEFNITGVSIINIKRIQSSKYIITINDVVEEWNIATDIVYDNVDCLVFKTQDDEPKFDGEMLYFTYWETDSGGTRINELINLNFSETNGLTWFNTAVDRPANSDASIILNGSSDGTQWDVNDLQYPKNLIEGFNKVGYFDGVRYGSYPQSDDYKVDNFEINITFILPDDISVYVSAFKLWGDDTQINNYLQIQSNGQVRFYINGAGTLSSTQTFTKGVSYHIRCVKYGTTALGYLDGIEIINYAPLATVTYPPAQTLWTLSKLGTFTTNNLVYSFTHHELDVLGNRIKELVNFDWKNGDEVSVPNIAADAPADSDMTWTAGTGAYTLIPADLVNPTKDILGNILQITGDGRINNSAPNTYNRNPMDAPELVEAGILDTEDISYEDITGDQSRFYDNKDENKVINQLVYSDDYLAEPIAGSAGNFPRVIYGRLDHLIEYDLQEFEVHIVGITEAGFQSWDIFGAFGSWQSNERTAWTIRPENDGGAMVFFYSTARNLATRYSFGTYNIGDDLDVRIKIYGGNIYWELNGQSGSDTFTDTIYYWQTPITDYDWWVGRSSEPGISTYSFYGKLYNIEYYSLDSGGTRVDELITLKFSETNGLTSYNTAADRPTGSTDMTWVLGGVSDGTQWLADGNLDYHHNLQYGKVTGGYFDGVRYLSTPDNAGLKPQYCEVVVKLNVLDDIFYRTLAIQAGDSPVDTEGIELVWTTATSHWTWQIGKQVSGLIQTAMPVTTFSDVNELGFKFFENRYQTYLNGVLDTDESTGAFINPINWGNSNRVGRSNRTAVDILKGNYFSVEFYELDASGNRIAELINLDWKNGTETSVPNIALNPPSGNTNMTWTAGTGEYVQVPGDPSNYQIDINGFPIDNPEQVKKYRKINRFLRK